MQKLSLMVKYMRIAAILYVSFVVAVGMGFAANPPKDPTALALLRGVESVRAKYDNLRTELVLEYIDRTQRCTLPCLVEQSGQHRRFEQFSGSCLQEGIVTIVHDREVWSYRRKKYQDLDIYDMERSVGVRGDIAFDPRILGLAEIPMTADETLRRDLWIETCDRLEILGREKVKGISTWHIKEKWNYATSDIWIEEPFFRVHKRLFNYYDIVVEINSEFDTQSPTFPFPKRVEITREEGKEQKKKWKRLEVTVKSFEVDKPIPAERFTMKSIGLPLNTMINDYRIKRILGYWDGEGISKKSIYLDQESQQPVPPRLRHPHRLLLIGLNAFVILALVIVLVWRWRRRIASTK